MELILASASPRRREMLELMGYDFSVIPSRAEENIPLCPPGAYVEALALAKAREVSSAHPDCCVVGSDTIVYLDSAIIGKPRDKEDAFRILSLLSGRTHRVYTGVAILAEGKQTIFHDHTDVTFSPLAPEEIRAYIGTGEPLDKAGAYGIQGPGSALVARVEGCYFTVIGMPNPLLYGALREFGVLPRWQTARSR